MNALKIVYHGSGKVIERPEFGKGKPYNDYGLGFYCTEHLELAKEWACSEDRNGYANKYELDLSALRVLDLNGGDFCIVHWISILLRNRKFSVDSDLARNLRGYILENFPVATEGYDVVMGYRANDSYFAYARDFLHNSISVRRLKQVMKLGNLGNQIALISQKAFSQIKFLGAEVSLAKDYYQRRLQRDRTARDAYLHNRAANAIDLSDVYLIDIVRNSMRADDARLR